MTSPAFLTPDPGDSAVDPLLLTVRFSASIPDLLLDIPYPEITTAAGLKQLIRARLPSDLSAHRLRLIYAGRGLEDAAPLTLSLKLPPSPARTPRPAADSSDNDNVKGKGKEPVRYPPLAPDRPRLYIHCSIGDIVLSEDDLAAEAALASTLKNKRRTLSRDDDDEADEREALLRKQQQQPFPSTTPAPRGFDRLLSAGFTASEVAALRSQFLALHAVSRTPDTMPSGAELWELEDRWLDEGSAGMAVGVGGGGGVAFGDDDWGFGAGSREAIDDILWGTVMGFFWPVGCVMWLSREEQGMWSWWKEWVFIGVALNAVVGAIRILY